MSEEFPWNPRFFKAFINLRFATQSKIIRITKLETEIIVKFGILWIVNCLLEVAVSVKGGHKVFFFMYSKNKFHVLSRLENYSQTLTLLFWSTESRLSKDFVGNFSKIAVSGIRKTYAWKKPQKDACRDVFWVLFWHHWKIFDIFGLSNSPESFKHYCLSWNTSQHMRTRYGKN